MTSWTNRVLRAFGLLMLVALVGSGAWAQEDDDPRPPQDPPAAEQPSEDDVDGSPDDVDEGDDADDADEPSDGDAEESDDAEGDDEAEPAQPAEDQPVSVRYEIFVVSEVTNEDGERQERLVEATSARPGQTVEYRVFAQNEGDTTLPAGLVTVTGPVPDGTEFVEDSATPGSERVRTEYSADGGASFGEPPILVGSGEDQDAVDPSSYDAVRWTLLEPMEPGQEETFFYRVVVR